MQSEKDPGEELTVVFRYPSNLHGTRGRMVKLTRAIGDIGRGAGRVGVMHRKIIAVKAQGPIWHANR